MTEALLLPIAGLADRIRGGYPAGKRPKWVRDASKVVIGMVMALQLTHDWRLVLASGLVAALLAWRWDHGWRGKWVRAHAGQWFYEKKEGDMRVVHGFSEATLIREAAQWALLSSVFGYLWLGFYVGFDIMAIFTAAYIVGTLVAMQLAQYVPITNFMESRGEWARGELIEFPIIGLFLQLGLYLRGIV